MSAMGEQGGKLSCLNLCSHHSLALSNHISICVYTQVQILLMLNTIALLKRNKANYMLSTSRVTYVVP